MNALELAEQCPVLQKIVFTKAPSHHIILPKPRAPFRKFQYLLSNDVELRTDSPQ